MRFTDIITEKTYVTTEPVVEIRRPEGVSSAFAQLLLNFFQHLTDSRSAERVAKGFVRGLQSHSRSTLGRLYIGKRLRDLSVGIRGHGIGSPECIGPVWPFTDNCKALKVICPMTKSGCRSN